MILKRIFIISGAIVALMFLAVLVAGFLLFRTLYHQNWNGNWRNITPKTTYESLSPDLLKHINSISKPIRHIQIFRHENNAPAHIVRDMHDCKSGNCRTTFINYGEKGELRVFETYSFGNLYRTDLGTLCISTRTGHEHYSFLEWPFKKRGVSQGTDCLGWRTGSISNWIKSVFIFFDNFAMN
jgi:hypothetical protein